jgi:hypothetical protein
LFLPSGIVSHGPGTEAEPEAGLMFTLTTVTCAPLVPGEWLRAVQQAGQAEPAADRPGDLCP